MGRVTKQELQNRLDEAEAQITSLRDELSQATLHIGDLEEELSQDRSASEQSESSVDSIVQQLVTVDVQQGQIESLINQLDGFSHIVAYSASVALAIEQYTGPNPDRREYLATALLEDLQEVLDEINNGDFDADTIRGELGAELEAAVLMGNEPCGPDCTCQDEFSGSGNLQAFLEFLPSDGEG